MEAKNLKSKYSPEARAALVVLALGEEAAAEVIQYLSDHEIEKIAKALSYLNQVSDQQIKLALDELQDQLDSKKTSSKSGNIHFTQSILKRALDEERAQKILQKINTHHQLSFLSDISPKAIASYLLNEHPQASALILSLTPPDVFGRVLQYLPEENQGQMFERIAQLKPVSPDVIDEMAEVLKKDLYITQNINSISPEGDKKIAHMLHTLDRTTEKTILKIVGKRSPTLLQRIEKLMFVFEDLVQINDRGIQELSKYVSNEKWKFALKDAPVHVINHILNNMSERAATILLEDIEDLGMVKTSLIQEARSEIIKHVRNLEDKGKLIVRRG